MDPPARVEATRRLTWLVGAILLWGAAILAKLVSLQVVHHADYVRIARQQQERLIEIPAPRGSIFDRNGQPLAMSVPVESVHLNPLRVPDLAVASGILASILELDRQELYGRMQWAVKNHRGFLWVKRKIEPEQAERLRSLHLDWIEFETESQRHYPKGSVAAHVLGSVDREERGNAGLEMSADTDLRGRPGAERMLTDVKRRGIDAYLSTQPRAGLPITLSIDERIQFAAEQALASAVAEHHANSGSVVVMKPSDGEVLAMASFPSFDPNQPPRPGEDASRRFNHAISVPFEPGSVFKVVTLSAALETTSLRPDSLINCGGGRITLFGRTIHEAHGGYGTIPMEMVLAKSSNIGAIQIGMRVGQEKLYEYVRRFGFGARTGVPLPAESAGMVRKLARWGKTSLSSVAMGHEVSTTTVQLALACSAVANGGLLMHPQLILRRGNDPTPMPPPRRILKPETAITMRQMMEGVVLHGTGRRARLEGYTSGGKTGSAQIFDFATRHYTHSYNASFLGFAPVTNPAIVVVVTLNGTRGGSSGFGGVAAAPVFKIVATEALRVLDVPKDLPEETPGPVVSDAPDDLDDLAIADLSEPEPPDDQAQTAVKTLVASVPPAAAAAPSPDPGPRVPNFQGMTMRAVMAEASARGMTVLLDGSGLARGQQPPPGSRWREGERIRVQFAR